MKLADWAYVIKIQLDSALFIRFFPKTVNITFPGGLYFSIEGSGMPPYSRSSQLKILSLSFQSRISSSFLSWLIIDFV